MRLRFTWHRRRGQAAGRLHGTHAHAARPRPASRPCRRCPGLRHMPRKPQPHPRRGDGRTNVGAKVDALDSSRVGSITLDDILKVMGDMRQAHRERTSGTGLDAAVGTAANLATPLLDNPPTRMSQTGVDAQDNQANLPSQQAQRKTRPRASFTNVCSRKTQRGKMLKGRLLLP